MVNPDSIPRYAQPMDTEPEGPCCGDCATYKDASSKQEADGSTHWLGVCIYEVFHAKTLDELARAEVYVVEPDMDACEDYEGDI